MITEIRSASPENIAYAGRLISEGKLVAFPTETVYGLGANALDAKAVEQIFVAKGRPGDNPLIVHIAEMEELSGLVLDVPVNARKLMDAFWPGPMTLILPKRDCIPDTVSAGLDTVGIRMPGNASARALIAAAHCPIAAPSANRSGRPSPTCAMHVFEDMEGRIPLILDDGPCAVGVESTVIDAREDVPIILRPGGITPEMIDHCLGAVRLDEHILSPVQEGTTVRSPGMKYRHYAPEAKTVIFSGDEEKVREEIIRRYDAEREHGGKPVILALDNHNYGQREILSLGSVEEPEAAAARLFAALRELDHLGCTLALCEAVDTAGIGLAVMNRMGRAAGFDIVRL
ncbi:MAG: threonylcarbamoyl-AMP synthase [Clostridia bacterium]|nr:threonylcarbamoyl-AMP synthase [Clostridia bacterium]